jgi:C4-dicarboxylate-specific signal transduction histidine kinase
MSLELKRKELEFSRVELARQELELKIEERKDEISRLEKMIDIQIAKEKELKAEILALRNKGE